MKQRSRALLASIALMLAAAPALSQALPDTGISGVYEVMVGARDAQPLIKYFAEFGFAVVEDAEYSREQAQALYGVPSGLKSYRLRNHGIDSHGLLRVLEWAEPTGPGVGYAPPETVGQRLAVMRTLDIFRLADVFTDARHKGEPWLVTPPVYDDLYGLSDKTPDFFDRRVGVREGAVYGELFNHVFYQRYGYVIPGYGTIEAQTPLQTSEFTHHDFVIKGDIAEVTRHYSDVLGLRAESEPQLDGDWRNGPRTVFDMGPGVTHGYVGFVSPNNICGKLKFFAPTDIVRDRSDRQHPGQLGITLHSLRTPRLSLVHELALEHHLGPSAIIRNEFDENSFAFTGPDGVTWQIIEGAASSHTPKTKLEFVTTGN